jgi:antirestriction protein
MTESTIATPAAECRIYVACLASYNAGRLFGRWIDVDGKSGDELQQEVNELLRRSPCPNVERVACGECGHIQDASLGHGRPFDPELYSCDECGHETAIGPFASAEEWAIHDHEGFGGNIGEYTPLNDVAELAEALADDDKAIGLRFLLWNGYKLAEAIEKAGDVILQEGRAAAAVEAYHDETGMIDELPEWARHHIDFESIARDWQDGGDLVEWADSDGTLYCVMNSNSL